MIIKDILDTKEAEKKKEQEKLERDGGLSMRKAVTIIEEPPVVVPDASPIKASPAKKGAKQEVVFEKSEAEKEREAKLEEIKKYGVRQVSVFHIIYSDNGYGRATTVRRRRKCGWQLLKSSEKLILTCYRTLKTTYCFRVSRAKS